MWSVANMCAVIVQQIATESCCFLNDVLVCMFMHFKCLRSYVDAIIPVPEFLGHVTFRVLLSPR